MSHYFFSQLPSWVFILIVGLLIAASALCLKRVFYYLRYVRLIEDTATSSIRSAPQGYVELEGHAQSLKGIECVGPLSNKPCCWYSYRLEVLKQRRVNNRVEKYWETLQEGASHHLFILEDGTGKCIICPVGAKMMPQFQKQWYRRELPIHLQKNSKKSFWNNLNIGKPRYRFFEARVEFNDHLYVLGCFQTIPLKENLVEEKNVNHVTAELNAKAPGVGSALMPVLSEIVKINAEWKSLAKNITKDPSFEMPDYINVITNKNLSPKQPYLISTFSQKELAKKYKWKAFKYGFLFVLVGAFPFWMMLKKIS